MSDYDRAVREAKDRVTNALCRMDVPDHDVAKAVEDLNAAWDELADALVRQREVMRETIDNLHHRLAEMKKRGGA